MRSGFQIDLALALLVFLAALSPRLDLAQRYDEPPQSEERLYNRYAIPWSQGEGYDPRELWFDWHPLGSFTHRPPAYALYLGSIYRAAGVENFPVVRHSQAWMDSLSAVLVFCLGILVYGGWQGRAAGLAAGLVTARYDFLLSFVARLLSEPLFLFFCLVFLCLALLAERSRSPRRRIGLAFLAAYVLGWANLVRPFVIFVLPGYLLWIAIGPGRNGREAGDQTVAPTGRMRERAVAWARRQWQERKGELVAATLGMLLAIAPVTLRNWQFHGRFILISTNSGFTLYKSLIKVQGLEAPEEIPSEESIDALELGEVAEQAAFRQAALDYMWAHPRDIPKIYQRKLQLLWDAKDGHKISHVLTPTPMDSWLYPLVLLGALASLLVLPRQALHPRLLILGTIASQYLVSILANAEVRYRVPAVPLLALLAIWVVLGPAGKLLARGGTNGVPGDQKVAPTESGGA